MWTGVEVVVTNAQSQVPASGARERGASAQRSHGYARQGDRTKFHFFPRFEIPTGRDPPPKRPDDNGLITAMMTNVSVTSPSIWPLQRHTGSDLRNPCDPAATAPVRDFPSPYRPAGKQEGISAGSRTKTAETIPGCRFLEGLNSSSAARHETDRATGAETRSPILPSPVRSPKSTIWILPPGASACDAALSACFQSGIMDSE